MGLTLLFCYDEYIFLTMSPLHLAKEEIHYLKFHTNLFAAMLAYKTVSGTKSFKKLVHLALQFLAFSLSLVGLWAALKFHNDKGIDNFYSLHSWLGLTCLSLFVIQVFSSASQFLTSALTFLRSNYFSV